MRHNPFFPSKIISNVLDEAFSRGIDVLNTEFGFRKPQVNISETDTYYQYDLVAPGLEKEDFKISIDKGYLKISVAKDVNPEDKTTWLAKEYNFNAFERSFQLAQNADVNNIQAKYDQGILHVSIHKKEALTEKPEITIEIK